MRYGVGQGSLMNNFRRIALMLCGVLFMAGTPSFAKSDEPTLEEKAEEIARFFYFKNTMSYDVFTLQMGREFHERLRGLDFSTVNGMIRSGELVPVYAKLFRAVIDFEGGIGPELEKCAQDTKEKLLRDLTPDQIDRFRELLPEGEIRYQRDFEKLQPINEELGFDIVMGFLEDMKCMINAMAKPNVIPYLEGVFDRALTEHGYPHVPEIDWDVDIRGRWNAYFGVIDITRDADGYTGTKITGSANVPAGEIAFTFDLKYLSCQAQRADEGFINPRWVDCKIHEVTDTNLKTSMGTLQRNLSEETTLGSEASEPATNTMSQVSNASKQNRNGLAADKDACRERSVAKTTSIDLSTQEQVHALVDYLFVDQIGLARTYVQGWGTSLHMNLRVLTRDEVEMLVQAGTLTTAHKELENAVLDKKRGTGGLNARYADQFSNILLDELEPEYIDILFRQIPICTKYMDSDVEEPTDERDRTKLRALMFTERDGLRSRTIDLQKAYQEDLSAILESNPFREYYLEAADTILRRHGQPAPWKKGTRACPLDKTKGSQWSNCFGTRSRFDGSKYTGTFKRGRYHGHGIASYRSQPKDAKYTGAWQNHRQHGEGTFLYEDGQMYAGNFRTGMRHGQGTYTWPDGMIYEGNFRYHARNGKGRLVYANGAVYDGEWVSDKRAGKGTMWYADGRKYTGRWQDSRRDGKGVVTYPNGNKYVGTWEAGARTGKGTLRYANGTRKKCAVSRIDGFDREGDWKLEERICLTKSD